MQTSSESKHCDNSIAVLPMVAGPCGYVGDMKPTEPRWNLLCEGSFLIEFESVMLG